ncbi:MAG: hypothetical protein GTN36_06165 [Candidatus Aenigmarchaeota archaeon]|nr:hypothetical protein [Candidatus Aenigmarchaeota archaeon]
MVDLLNMAIGSLQEGYMFFYSQLSPIIGETYLRLFVFTIGLFIYAIFVWHFYRTLAKRDLFKIDLEKYNLPHVKHKTLGKAGSVIAYILKYGFIFPVYIFIWFLILSSFLLVLTEETTINNILLISIVVVSTTRVTSYYNENLSTDLAKLVPFALLGVSLIDPNFFSMETTVARFSEIPNLWSQILQFLIFSIVLEWILRILYLIKRGFSGSKKLKESKTT